MISIQKLIKTNLFFFRKKKQQHQPRRCLNADETVAETTVGLFVWLPDLFCSKGKKE